MNFSELSERAKDNARGEYRGPGYMDYNWWDNVYDDAVHMGALMGIAISSEKKKTSNGKHTYNDIGIQFSGFCCQGDGACFEGGYCIVKDGLEKITAETNDEELIRIAGMLSVFQLARRLKGLEPFSAVIKASGYYSHSGTMDVDVQVEEDTDYSDLKKDVTQLMRDFADLIYKWLEQEFDWLMSDECVDEHLNELEFDEDGAVVEYLS